MLIIVDGPNGAGKTTLVENLKKWIENNLPTDRVQVLHKGPPTEHPLIEYVWPLLAYRPGTFEHIICDRWHWGEYVYPDLLDRPTAMDRGVWRYVEMFLRSRGALVVYPYVSTATLVDRIRRRGDELITTDHIPREWASFNAVRFRSTLPVHMSSHLPEYDDAPQAIFDKARECEYAAAVVNTLVTYVGPPRPDFLLVGDVRSRREMELTPAFGPFPATSGHFLMNALAGPRTIGLGVMNANDVDDLYSAWVGLRTPPVVSLGRRASRTLDDAGIAHSKVPHPQFIRRFYYRHQAMYGSIIDEAMATRKDHSKWRP